MSPQGSCPGNPTVTHASLPNGEIVRRCWFCRHLSALYPKPKGWYNCDCALVLAGSEGSAYIRKQRAFDSLQGD